MSTGGPTTSLSATTAGPKGYVLEDYTERCILAVLACSITAVGVPGNTLVILAVALSKRLQTRTNFFIVNLACSDLVTCLTLPFQAVSLLNDDLPFPKLFCKAVAVLFWLGVGSSLITLALIALVRFYVITKPRQTYTNVFRRRNLVLMTIGAWSVPFLLMVIPPQFDIGDIGYSERYKICTTDSSQISSDVYSALNGLAVPVPCFVVIIVCYVRIYLFVRRTSMDVVVMARCGSGDAAVVGRNTPRTALEVAVFCRQVKVAKNLFIVMCAYSCCVMPFGLTAAIPADSYAIVPWTFIFFCVNCCINPIIYGLKHPQFQKAIWSYLREIFKKGPEHQPLISRAAEGNN